MKSCLNRRNVLPPDVLISRKSSTHNKGDKSFIMENFGGIFHNAYSSLLLPEPGGNVLAFSSWEVGGIPTAKTHSSMGAPLHRQPPGVSYFQPILQCSNNENNIILVSTYLYTQDIQINGTGINPCLYDELIYDKGGKNMQWEKR